MNNSISICVLLVFSFLSTNVSAQKNTENQNLVWMRYYLKLKISPEWQLRQEFSERAYWFPWRQHQFVSRTIGERKLGKGWSIGPGFTYFLQSLPHDPEVTDFYNRTELRPQLEIAYKQDLSPAFSLHHRYWSEFRFFEQDNGSYRFGNTRFRYKVEIQYHPAKELTLKAFDEIHMNIGHHIVHNVFDQNRYGASVQYYPLKNFGFELGYLNWFQQRSTGTDFYNRHILRFTIHHTIQFSNSKNQ